MIIAIVLLLFVLLAIGVPVAVAIGIPSIIYVVLTDNIPNFTAVQRMVAGVNVYTIIAIPLFIFAGNLMNTGGITVRIFDACKAFVGRVKGGLAHVNIMASVIFAGMSGAAVADAGGLGAIEIKAMRESNYDDRMTLGVTAASSVIGPIIPPSMPIVMYGVVASTSIGRLFAAGVVPGLLMALALMSFVVLLSRRMNCPKGSRYTLKEKFDSFRKALLALMAPSIILGGIFTGFVTPTEAAAIACLYAIILGVWYRELGWKEFAESVRSSMVTTIQVLFIVASATLFAWMLSIEQVPQNLAKFITEQDISPLLLLLVINIFLLIVGLFMETVASINLLVPILLPIAVAIGVDPVQFGIIMIVNLIIGTLTPPFGTVLFVLSGVSGVPVEKVSKSVLIFLSPLVIILVLVNLFPQLTLWLPNLLFGVSGM